MIFPKLNIMSSIVTDRNSEIEDIFSMAVSYDKEPSAWIRRARLVSEDLRVNVKDEVEIFQTSGKAYYIDRQTLPEIVGEESQVRYTLIQKTTAGFWIAFNYITNTTTNLKDVFVTAKKSRYDENIILYPFIPVFAALIGVEFFLFYKAFKHEYVFFTKTMVWVTFSWAVTLFSITLFILYRVRSWEVQTSYFSIIRSERYPLSLDCYLPIKKKFGWEYKRYSMKVMSFTGKFWNGQMSDRDLFGISSSNSQTSRQKEIMELDTYISELERELDQYDEILFTHEEKLFSFGVTVGVDAEKGKYPETLEKKEFCFAFDKVVELRAIQTNLKSDLKALEVKRLSAFKIYYKEVKAILDPKLIDADSLTEKRAHELIQANATIESYRQEADGLRRAISTLETSNSGIAKQFIDQSEKVNLMANLTAASYYKKNYISPSHNLVLEGETESPKTSFLDVFAKMQGTFYFFGGLIVIIILLVSIDKIAKSVNDITISGVIFFGLFLLVVIYAFNYVNDTVTRGKKYKVE